MTVTSFKLSGSRLSGCVAAMAALMTLAACSPPHPHQRADAALRVITALDCPASEGDLKLGAPPPTPNTCVYTAESGDKVTLQLVSLTATDAKTALAPFEAAAVAALPVATPSTSGGATSSSDASSKGGDKSGDDDKVDINLPGIHIHTSGDGTAQVNAMGVHVDADENGPGGQHAVVTTRGGDRGGVSINASDAGARIKFEENGAGVRSMILLTTSHPGANGYRSAGYQARGPVGGPIVVASFLTKSDDHDAISHDVKALLKDNVGR